jgi:hypothetical protein
VTERRRVEQEATPTGSHRGARRLLVLPVLAIAVVATTFAAMLVSLLL